MGERALALLRAILAASESDKQETWYNVDSDEQEKDVVLEWLIALVVQFQREAGGDG